jgi:hypothetical protein
MLDLTLDEKTALIGILAGLVESDPFPQSPRIQQLRGILTKLRVSLAKSKPPDDAADPETTEQFADVDEAEALKFAEDLRSGEPQSSATSRPKKPLSGLKPPGKPSHLRASKRDQVRGRG